ncbi:hypothetical protein TNCV_1887811 [Trichonephila clavipes]|nr:hypothetical protein TNCV_1887811 [Trichonephila clavipes]
MSNLKIVSTQSLMVSKLPKFFKGDDTLCVTKLRKGIFGMPFRGATKLHLKDYDRGRAVGRLEAGQNITIIAAAMSVSKSVISKLKKVAEGGNTLQKHAGRCSRNNTPLEEHYVSLVTKRDRNFTPGQVAANLITVTGTNVSARTISW